MQNSIMGDETWVVYYYPELRATLSEYRPSNLPHVQKVRSKKKILLQFNVDCILELPRYYSQCFFLNLDAVILVFPVKSLLLKRRQQDCTSGWKNCRILPIEYSKQTLQEAPLIFPRTHMAQNHRQGVFLQTYKKNAYFSELSHPFIADLEKSKSKPTNVQRSHYNCKIGVPFANYTERMSILKVVLHNEWGKLNVRSLKFGFLKKAREEKKISGAGSASEERYFGTQK